MIEKWMPSSRRDAESKSMREVSGNILERLTRGLHDRGWCVYASLEWGATYCEDYYLLHNHLISKYFQIMDIDVWCMHSHFALFKSFLNFLYKAAWIWVVQWRPYIPKVSSSYHLPDWLQGLMESAPGCFRTCSPYPWAYRRFSYPGRHPICSRDQKRGAPGSLKDFRAVSFTSCFMKAFEKPITGQTMNLLVLAAEKMWEKMENIIYNSTHPFHGTLSWSTFSHWLILPCCTKKHF